jgi:hypothetical protein
MTKVIMPTTDSVERVCGLLDDLIGDFIRTRSEILNLGKYEAEAEAWNLFNITVRNIEGVIVLARHDLVLVPPALMAARAGFEAAIKAARLVDADDPFDREARWLVHLASEERYQSRSAKEWSEIAQDATVLGQFRDVRLRLAEVCRQHEASFRDFRLAVTEMLPPHTVRFKSMPNFKDMLAAVGGKELYQFYILISQTAHAEHHATWLYRAGGVGTAARFGEFVEPSAWWLPLKIGFFCFTHPCLVFLTRLGGKPEHFLSSETYKNIEEAIAAIGEEPQTVSIGS